MRSSRRHAFEKLGSGDSVTTPQLGADRDTINFLEKSKS